MFLADLYDSWFPPLNGIGNSILRPFVWLSTAFIPVVMMFVCLCFGGLEIGSLENTWAKVFGVIMFLFSPFLTLWWYRIVVDHLEYNSNLVVRLTQVNTVVLPVVFSSFYYGAKFHVEGEPTNWNWLVITFLVSCFLFIFLGKIHRASLSTDESVSSATQQFLEKILSNTSGFAVPGWIRMHFRYIDKGLGVWFFLLFIPGLLLMIITPVIFMFIQILTESLFDWKTLSSNIATPNMWGLISINYILWGLVVYAMERRPLLRRFVMGFLFILLSVLSISFYFIEGEHGVASLGETIFVNVGMVVLIFLGCLAANHALKTTTSPDPDLGLTGHDMLLQAAELQESADRDNSASSKT